MASMSADFARPGSTRKSLRELAYEEGSVSHPYCKNLGWPGAPMRDVADAVHYFCALHASHPGVIDHAGARAADVGATEWATIAKDAFHEERAYLMRLTTAAGPPPSTPGQAETETVAVAQRHALEMLGMSDRKGCAVGAAIALCIDWITIRAVLDCVADRLGVLHAPTTLPDRNHMMALVATIAATAPTERAMMFGARQLLAQHRGLWDLLEVRADARDRD